jgi:mannose-P-dolichol utilization defect protein 1
VPSFELEVAGFTIALAYCLFKQLPFSAYGELVFILLQSLICLALIYYYSPHRGKGVWIKSALYCALAPTLLAGKLDATLFEALYACQHAIFFFARLPQIWENFQTKNTGQLSFLTNFMATGGCVGASLLIPLPALFPVFSRFRVLIRIHLYCMQLC